MLNTHYISFALIIIKYNPLEIKALSPLTIHCSYSCSVSSKSVSLSYFTMSTNLATTQSSELAIFHKPYKNFKDVRFHGFILSHEIREIIYP